MAVDQTLKRKTLALALMAAVEQFMEGIEEAKNLTDEAASAGLTFVDGDFSSVEALKHIDATSFGTARTNVTNLVTHLVTNSIDDVFNAIRP